MPRQEVAITRGRSTAHRPFRGSSAVEQSAVNRSVVGSNPTPGAIVGGALFLWRPHLPALCALAAQHRSTASPARSWPGRRLAAILLATSLLAACAEKRLPPPPIAPPEPAVEAPVAPAPKVPVPKRKPAPPSSPPNATIGPPEPLHPEPAPSTEPVPSPPDVVPPVKIEGLEAAAVEERLGPPQVQADSPPAFVWRYAAGDCAVDVYLYKDLQSGALRALFVDVKGDDRSDQRREVCLQRLAERHAADAPPPR